MLVNYHKVDIVVEGEPFATLSIGYDDGYRNFGARCNHVSR